MKKRVIGVMALLLCLGAASAPAYIDNQLYLQAKELGLKLPPTWNPDFVDIIRGKKGYPLFIQVGALVDATSLDPNYIHIVFYKGSKDAPFKAFKIGRNLDFTFSPSGKHLMINDNYLAGRGDTYVVAMSVFESMPAKTIQHEFTDSTANHVKIDHYELPPAQRVSFEALATQKLPLAKACAHLDCHGQKWLDESHVALKIDGQICDNGLRSVSGAWTAVFNMKSKELEEIMQIDLRQ